MFKTFLYRYASATILAALSALLVACSALPGQDAAGTGALRPMAVEAVTVQVGVGSPIPVDVVASGTWNDLCAQLARVDQKMDGQRIEISLMASEADPTCPPDHLGVPFRVAVPLNIVEMDLGTYQIAVNGVETSFEWDPVKINASRPYSEPAIVTDVEVEIGVGSPIPIAVNISGEFPNTCAQLGNVEQLQSGNAFQINVLAVIPPASEACKADGLPFRASIPLNAVSLDPGSYTVDVNGKQATFDWMAGQ